MLGLKQRGAITVCEWLPPLPGSKFERESRGPSSKDPRKRKAYDDRVRRRDEKRALVSQFIQRIYHKDELSATSWKFKVNFPEPLIQEHQAQYDLVTGFIKGLYKTNDLQMIRDVLNDYAFATTDYADTTSDYAIEALSEDVVTRLQQGDYANVTNHYPNEKKELRVRDALNT